MERNKKGIKLKTKGNDHDLLCILKYDIRFLSQIHFTYCYQIYEILLYFTVR